MPPLLRGQRFCKAPAILLTPANIEGRPSQVTKAAIDQHRHKNGRQTAHSNQIRNECPQSALAE